jgi:hypothetical protein
MTPKRIPIALIVLTTLIFSLSHILSGKYWIGLASCVIGVLWVLAEIYKMALLPHLFFASFIGFAAVGSQNGLPVPLMLFGVCTDLAAWDLSRFQTRIREFTKRNPGAEIIKKHLVKLTATIGIGYILACLPLFIRFSMSFIIVVVLTLLTILVLRQSILIIWNEKISIHNK